MTRDMSAAEVACLRHLIGLTLSDLAREIGVDRRSAGSWAQGRDRINPRNQERLLALVAEHDTLTDNLLWSAKSGQRILLPAQPRPRGWYKAAGARLLALKPDASLDWAMDR